MSTSPTATVSAPGCGIDVFDQLARCQRLLTARELASILAISPKTIYSYVERNMIPHYKIEASVRFRARDVVEWLHDRACRHLEAPGPRAAAQTRLVRSA
jgi:excisionase family DNA binding protein